MTETEALKRFIPILGRISSPNERANIVNSILERIGGNANKLMAVSHKQLGVLAWPTDEAQAAAFEKALDAAVDADQLVSILRRGGHRRALLVEDLSAWPDCPAISPDSPLAYWIGEPASTNAATESQPAPTTPQPAAHQPEQVKPPRKRYRRLGWQSDEAAFDYVVSVYVSVGPVQWKVLEKALKDRATDETPVGLRHGKHGKFFIRGLGTEVTGKTMLHAFPAIRAQAAKLPRNPHSPAKHSRE